MSCVCVSLSEAPSAAPPHTQLGPTPPTTALSPSSPLSSDGAKVTGGVKAVSPDTDLTTTIQSINEIREALMDPSKRANLSPTTGSVPAFCHMYKLQYHPSRVHNML